MESVVGKCFICGNLTCNQEIDHRKITLEQFNELMRLKAGHSPQISFLKLKINKAFKKLARKSGLQFATQEHHLNLFVDKLHFWYLLQRLSSLKPVEAAIYGYMLPRSQLISLIDSLINCSATKEVFPGFKFLFEEVHFFKKNYRNIIQNQDFDYLFRTFNLIIDELEREYRAQKSFGRFTQRITIENEAVEIVTIEGVPFSTKRTSIDLSMLNIRDKELITYVPSLQKMKNLQEVSLGNNQLSGKGFRILFNVISHIKCLDLRNSNSDMFVDCLCQKMSHLEALYLNKTMLDTDKLNRIVNYMPNLRILYIDQNEDVSKQIISWIVYHLKHLMYMSAKDILSNVDQCQQLKLFMIERGGYFWS